MAQVQFARSNALASYKAKSMDSIAAVSILYLRYNMILTFSVGPNCPSYSAGNGIAH